MTVFAPVSVLRGCFIPYSFLVPFGTITPAGVIYRFFFCDKFLFFTEHCLCFPHFFFESKHCAYFWEDDFFAVSKSGTKKKTQAHHSSFHTSQFHIPSVVPASQALVAKGGFPESTAEQLRGVFPPGPMKTSFTGVMIFRSQPPTPTDFRIIIRHTTPQSNPRGRSYTLFSPYIRAKIFSF